MKAIILAAGQGTRLAPYTDSKPKCLVPLAGKSLLKRQLEVLHSCGIEDICVVGGYRVEQLRAMGLPVIANQNYASNNVMGSLLAAREALRCGEDTLLLYGDIVYEPR